METAKKVFSKIGLGLLLVLSYPVTALAQTSSSNQPSNSGSFPLQIFTHEQGVSQSAQLAVQPIIDLLNWVIGIFSAILLVYALFHVLIHVKNVVEGKGHIRQYTSDFVTLGIAIIILMLAVTGGWYQILNFVYNFVVHHIFSVFKQAPTS